MSAQGLQVLQEAVDSYNRIKEATQKTRDEDGSILRSEIDKQRQKVAGTGILGIIDLLDIDEILDKKLPSPYTVKDKRTGALSMLDDSEESLIKSFGFERGNWMLSQPRDATANFNIFDQEKKSISGRDDYKQYRAGGLIFEEIWMKEL